MLLWEQCAEVDKRVGFEITKERRITVQGSVVVQHATSPTSESLLA